jgi:type III pantothenate kinase
MSAWLFDLGNSRLKCAPLHADGQVAIEQVREAGHDGMRFVDGGLDFLPDRIDRAVVASVVAPGLTAVLLDVLGRRCDRISMARTQPQCAGVRIAYAQPRRLGVDRFLALLAAHARARAPWLVVGVGTALTIDLLDAGGLHHGGRIAPSPTLMREALHARAPHLPPSGGDYSEFAADTADALASGCDGAALALIARSGEAAAARVGTVPQLLLHGGGADRLLSQLPAARFAPALVLEGLARWTDAVASM